MFNRILKAVLELVWTYVLAVVILHTVEFIVNTFIIPVYKLIKNVLCRIKKQFSKKSRVAA